MRLLTNYYKSLGYYDVEITSNTAEINKEGKYVLIDGRLRFWAWIILNGWNKPMDSIIINSTKI